jgi:hypothetical protein
VVLTARSRPPAIGNPHCGRAYAASKLASACVGHSTTSYKHMLRIPPAQRARDGPACKSCAHEKVMLLASLDSTVVTGEPISRKGNSDFLDPLRCTAISAMRTAAAVKRFFSCELLHRHKVARPLAGIQSKSLCHLDFSKCPRFIPTYDQTAFAQNNFKF